MIQDPNFKASMEALKKQCKQSFEEHMEELKIKPIPQAYDPRLGCVGYDPMSPYDVPRSQHYFRDIVEAVNKKGFAAHFPLSYTPVSTYFTKNNIVPYYNPSEAMDYGYGSLTIAGMVELVEMNAPWQIVRDEDIDLAIIIAEDYMRYLNVQGGDNPPQNIAVYKRKLANLLVVLRRGQEKMFVRTGKVNPRALDIVSLFKKLFGGNDDKN